jgi:predicted phosphoribosyltransferase
MEDKAGSASPDWDNVRFDRRPRGAHPAEDPAASRFAIGLTVFLVVALVFPWYAYWVCTRLLAADAEAALQQLAGESAAASAQWRAQASAANARQRERQQRDRIARVTVRGISEGSGATVVIVDLGEASLAEATESICRQVRRLRREGTYDALRVQRFRGAAPALTVGTIRCGY